MSRHVPVSGLSYQIPYKSVTYKNRPSHRNVASSLKIVGSHQFTSRSPNCAITASELH